MHEFSSLRSSTKRVAAFFLLATLAALSGCGGPRVRAFMNPEADLSYYRKVGVTPFRSLAADRLAGEKFTPEFTTALLASELFEVMDYGVFLSHVSKVIGSRPPSEPLSEEDIRQIAGAAGVQGVFVGSVSDFQMMSTPSGQFPVVTVEVRLLDAETSTVVWMATATERGGPKTPIIGMGEIHTLGELSQKVSKKLVRKLR